MSCFICVQCGTQHEETSAPRAECRICADERQYVNPEGQKWTKLEELLATHRSRFESEAERLAGVGVEPEFAIGQRALLVESPGGNLLWDCVSLIDADAIGNIEARGGLRAIAISHPHYYSSMVEWSRAFGNAPIYLHSSDARWVMRPSDSIQFWDSPALPLWDQMTLINCGGHFEGGTVLHWPAGAHGKGALLTGDIVQTVADPGWVSFMRSYPNLIPLGAKAIRQIVEALEPFEFEQIFAAWWKRNVLLDGKEVVRQSAARYLRAIGD
jgi:hypothetical protein